MWLPAETARLHELVIDPEGYSASRIVAILYDELRVRYTRNAILGKIFRMHWAGERRKPKPLGSASRTAHKVPRKPARQQAANGFNGRAIAQPPSPVPPTPIPDLHIPPRQRRSLGELENGFCRYPIGEPGQFGFFFCGGRAVKDKPYCKKHCAIAYRRDVRR